MYNKTNKPVNKTKRPFPCPSPSAAASEHASVGHDARTACLCDHSSAPLSRTLMAVAHSWFCRATKPAHVEHARCTIIVRAEAFGMRVFTCSKPLCHHQAVRELASAARPATASGSCACNQAGPAQGRGRVVEELEGEGARRREMSATTAQKRSSSSGAAAAVLAVGGRAATGRPAHQVGGQRDLQPTDRQPGHPCRHHDRRQRLCGRALQHLRRAVGSDFGIVVQILATHGRTLARTRMNK